MSTQHLTITRFLHLTDYSESARTVAFGILAFVVIFGIDMIGHLLSWSWYDPLVCDVLEAVILALITSQLLRLREERIRRRQHEIGYLNHHVRNSLALIQMAAQQVKDSEQRGSLVNGASSRICKVLEQLSRNEQLSIDADAPNTDLRHKDPSAEALPDVNEGKG